MAVPDPDAQRHEMLSRWERAAAGWGKRADGLRELAMPASGWMIEHLALRPGQSVLELAAGPGDTGFLAAELILPGGTLISSDAADAMLELARTRASQLGIENVEFKRLELEWIDLEAASVDAILCRWGVMLVVDSDAALREMRRVLRPGGRLAMAVWDAPERNPWATITSRALLELGHAQPPDPGAPGMFALSAPGLLQERLESAGFTDIVVGGVDLDREYPSMDAFIDETLDINRPFAEVFDALSEHERAEILDRITAFAEPFTRADGSLLLPGRTLVAAAEG